jgi:hypothetical protein
MNPRFAVFGVLLILAAACSDEKKSAQTNSLTTSPNAPRLTMKNLPANASTVCIANIRKRDEVLLKNASADHSALDAAIEDVCQ